ncbi:MAG: glycogen-binding domain-containing protein [Gemmatimonadetes bacterium]|nr:glycogen-binding domain-containing protein [Gemmatimonadota bacterium]
MDPRSAARVVALLSLTGLPLAAQPAGSLGVGASIIQYDGFLTSGAAVVVPAVRFDTPRFSIAGQGSWTVFESGNDVLQGNVAGGWLVGSRDWWRVELSGSAGAAKYANEPSSGHALGGARFHLIGKEAGGWFGVNTGTRFGSATGAPLEISAAGWRVRRRVALVGSVTATRLGADRYLDVGGAVRWTGSSVEVEARLGARPWTRSRGEVGDALAGGYGDLTARFGLTDRLSLSVGGGSYPSDPARRVLAAKYLNIGLRVVTLGSGSSATPLVSPGIARRVASSLEAAGPRLEVVGEGAQSRLRILAPQARTVDLMGDFTDWSVVPLVRVGPGVWEAAMSLPVGLHRLNVRVDGGAWVAPAGTRVERNEFGGSVGILVVR